MGGKREEERNLILAIKEYKKEFRENLKKALAKESEEKRKQGEIFFKGFWVPKERIGILHKKLKKRELVVLLEVHILFFILLIINILLLFAFNKFLLP